MAEIFQVQGKDAVIRVNQFAAISALTNFEFDARFNEEYLTELGREEYAAQTITPEFGGSMESTATGSLVGLLKRMITKQNATTGAFEGYLAGFSTSDTGFGSNAGTLRGRDLERAVFDVIESKKPNETFERSLLLPRAHLTQMSLRADAQGNATESFQFEGDMVRLYEKPYHDLVALPGMRHADNAVNMAKENRFSVTPGTAAASEYVIVHAMIDEVVVPRSAITVALIDPDGSLSAATPTTSGDEYNRLTLASGYTAPIGARISVVGYKKSPGTFPTLSNITTARFVKANQIDIFLVENTGANSYAKLANGNLVNHADFTNANRLLRAQNVDVSVDLRREALRQIAKNNTGNSVFYRAATYPLSVTSSMTMMETSLKEWAKLQGVDTSVEGSFLDLEQFEGKTWQLVVRYYYEGTPVQVVAVCDARVNAHSRRIAAGGRAEVTWGFTGSEFVAEAVNF